MASATDTGNVPLPVGADASADRVTPFAVIDVGSTAIRVAIAQKKREGGISIVESLQKPVSLGKNTFVHGVIEKTNIEECVQILRGFRRVLEEYQIPAEAVRVVATSAVREAANREAFLDRVFIATGLQVDPIDEAEVTRLTYLALQNSVPEETSLFGPDSDVCVVEVGGGSTELLHLAGGKVVFAHTYALGALRLRETIEAARTSPARVRDMMERTIQRTIEQLRQDVELKESLQFIVMGGDARFAVARLAPEARPGRLARLPVPAFAKLVDEVLTSTTDALVRNYGISFTDAETLGPALLAYLCLARSSRLRQILVAPCTLRDGLLHEMAQSGAWSADLMAQIVSSAIETGRKYQFDEGHARHVADLALRLFNALAPEHRLDSRSGLLLYLAALLHEIGNFVSSRSHHKHSMYLIMSSELFGLGRRDHRLVGLIARYHRRASPKPVHEVYNELDRDDRILVAKLASLLRVADALDRSHSRRIQDFRCQVDDGRLVITVDGVDDLALEQLGMKQKAGMFEEVYGLNVSLRRGAGPEAEA